MTQTTTPVMLEAIGMGRDEMLTVSRTSEVWRHEPGDPDKWIQTETEEIVTAATPEGVPDDYVYVPPDEEVGDDFDVVESQRGATYRSPEPVDDEDGETTTPLSERANEDGTISVENLQEGDVVQKGDEEIEIQGVGSDDVGTAVQFTDESGEEFFIYEDLLSNELRVPDSGSDEDAAPDAGNNIDAEFSEGQTVTFSDGREATVNGYDPETDVVAVTDENGEDWFQTGDAFREADDDDVESEVTQRIREGAGLPDEVSINMDDYPEEQIDDFIEGLNNFDDAVGVDDFDVFNITTEPPEDVSPAAGAAFHSGQRTLYMNPDGLSGDELANEKESGWTSTGSIQGTVQHEMVHSKHSQKLLDEGGADELDRVRNHEFDREEKELIQDEVSDYAAYNAFEFVAEVGAGILTGEEYSQDVMELYDEFSGIEVGE